MERHTGYLQNEYNALLRENPYVLEFLEYGFTDGVCYWDIANRQTVWGSPSFLMMAGCSESDAKCGGCELRDLLAQRDYQRLEIAVASHCDDPNNEIDLTLRLLHKRGYIRWLRCRGLAIRDGAGNPNRVLLAFFDVTGTRNEDVEHEEIKKRVDIIFNGTHDGMALVSVSLDMSFRYVLVNKAFRRYLGIDDERIIGKTPLEVFGPKDGQAIVDAYRSCIGKNVPLELEETVMTRNGRTYFQTSLMPFAEEDGNCYIIVSKKNITQQKLNERLLLESRQQLEAITKGSPEVLITVDKSLLVTYINRAQPPLTPLGVIGTSVLNYVGEDNRRLVEAKIKSVLGGAESETFDLFWPTAEDKTLCYRTKVVPLKKDGRNSEALLLSTDITNEISQETELKKWSQIFKVAGWGIVTASSDGTTFDLVNPSFADMHGYTVEELCGMPVEAVFAPNSRQRLPEELARIQRDGHHTFEAVHIRKDGTEFPVLVDGTEVKDECGNTLYRAVSVQDITSLKAAEKELAEEQALFMTTLLSIGDGVISTDVAGNIVTMNAVAEELTGWTNKEAAGKPFDKVFRLVNDISRRKVDSPMKKALESGKIVLLGSHTLLIRKDGSEVPIEDSAAPIKGADGRILGVVIVFRDYSEKKDKINKIEYLSFHDQLTGLYNRRFFDEELVRLDTKRNLPISVMMIDVNGLKLTNDAFGHATGDRLLKMVAMTLKKVFRKDEIVARTGGDEFVIILPKTDSQSAENIGKRIYAEIDQVRMGKVLLSVSVGHAAKTAEEESLKDALTKAEEMMYHKKITESQSMRNDTVKIILQTLNETNEREKVHSERVSKLARCIGEAASLDSETIKYLELAGLLHDIGKIAINKQVLYKPDRLTRDEFEEVKRHLDVGYQILKSVNEYTNLADAILSHHERWDGKGYPRALAGAEIPYVARVISLADAYEAMTAERPYRDALSKEAAINEIRKNAGCQFDPELVTVCEKSGWKMLDELDCG